MGCVVHEIDSKAQGIMYQLQISLTLFAVEEK
jgi:hypothetical protein